MTYSARDSGDSESASLHDSLQKVAGGLGLKLVEFALSKHKGSVQARAVIYNGGVVGLEECSRAHHAIMPRLELAFPGRDVHLEVSSPGINRQIKCGAEFSHYMGRGVSCYCKDVSEWLSGILESADEKGVVIKTRGMQGAGGTQRAPGASGAEGEAVRLEYEIIAKARLDSTQEVGIGN
ncbi:MAG: ribosome assembly cofactor RimP [Spirochaetes bacterium]|nr:ribosome assembly cofactor RimP [Spirochaetota bacterium]